MVMQDVFKKPVLDSSHDAQTDELSNHTLKVKPCLEGKGPMRTHVP